MTVPTSAPRPGVTVSHRVTQIMAGIKHETRSKPAMSITHDPWSTTGSIAERYPRRSTQLLLLPAAQSYRSRCCAASKTYLAAQRVDCRSILEGSAHTLHVTRAPCSQHVSDEIASVSVEPGVRTGNVDACTLGGAKAARWGRVLCMLVLAHANAWRSARQMHTLRYRFIRSSLEPEDAK